jgi:surface antigen
MALAERDETISRDIQGEAMTRNNFAAALAAIFFAAPAWAINDSFLKDAPISRLSKDELDVFWAFTMKTLDTAPDGKTMVWKAPKTTFTSRITLKRSFDDGGLKCREVTIASESGDRKMSGVYQLCKTGKGWEFRSSTK